MNVLQNFSILSCNNRSSLSIGSVVESFLGPCKSLKYIVNDDETVLICCPLLLLRTVSYLHPFEHLLEEVLCSHHEQYGCTNTTLFAMWYFWDQELKYLIEEGVEPCTVFSHVQNCLQETILLLQEIEIPLRKFFHFIDTFFSPEVSFCCSSNSSVMSSKMTSLSSKNCQYLKKTSFKVNDFSKPRNLLVGANQGLPYNVMLSSRHFSPSAKDSDDEDTLVQHIANTHVPAESMVILTEEDKVMLHKLSKKLCHVDFELNDLLSKVWEHQILYNKSAQFNLESFIVFPIVGSTSNSSVIDGLLIEINNKESFVSQCNTACSYKALLVTGDATPSYKHLGFSPTEAIDTYRSIEDMVMPAVDTWLHDCMNLILKLQVSLLLVRGAVDSSLLAMCSSRSVNVISHIPSQSFKILVKALDASPCSYIMACDERNVVTDITLCPSKVNMQKYVLQDKELLIIDTNSSKSKYSPQTVVLCHPCKATLNLREHQLWHAASRLALACQSKALLPGGGATEKWCSKTIMKLASSRPGEECKVFQAVASGFECYHRAVSKKLLLCENEPESALDERESKVQAWLSSASLLTTMLVDSCIINGYKKSQLYPSQMEMFVQYL